MALATDGAMNTSVSGGTVRSNFYMSPSRSGRSGGSGSRGSRGVCSGGAAADGEEEQCEQGPKKQKTEKMLPKAGSMISKMNTDAARMTTMGETMEIGTWMMGLSGWFSPEAQENIKRWQKHLYGVLKNWKFDGFIGFIILMNAVTVGLDQQMRLEDKPSSYWLVRFIFVSENIFLCIYCMELAMRFFALGPGCIADHWVKFDCLLVFMGILNSWILEPFVFTEGDGLGPLMVLRMGRLLRLARTVRLLVKFQVLWMLVRGLLTSAGTMLYTLLLLFIILYIFGCIGFELITSNPLVAEDAEFAMLVDDWFSDLPRIMLTLVQFVCLDSVGGIYRPLIQKSFILCFYFIGIILVVPIVLMNLVTAVIVNGAIEQAEQDREAVAIHEEQKKQRMVKDLRRIFMHLDADGSGNVTKEEIQQIDPKDKQMLERVTNIKDPLELFNALDVHKTNELNLESFCNGIWEVAISKVPLEVKKMEIQVDDIFLSLKELTEAQAAFRMRTDRMLNWQSDQLARLSQELLQGQSSTRKETRERLERIGKAVGVEELQSNFCPQDFRDRDRELEDLGPDSRSDAAKDGGALASATAAAGRARPSPPPPGGGGGSGPARVGPPTKSSAEALRRASPVDVPKDTPGWAVALFSEMRALKDLQELGDLIRTLRSPSFGEQSGGEIDPSAFVVEDSLPYAEMQGRASSRGGGAAAVGASIGAATFAVGSASGSISPLYGPPPASRPRFFSASPARGRCSPRSGAELDPVAGSSAAGGLAALRARLAQLPPHGGGGGAGLGIGGPVVALPWRGPDVDAGRQADGAAP